MSFRRPWSSPWPSRKAWRGEGAFVLIELLAIGAVVILILYALWARWLQRQSIARSSPADGPMWQPEPRPINGSWLLLLVGLYAIMMAYSTGETWLLSIFSDGTTSNEAALDQSLGQSAFPAWQHMDMMVFGPIEEEIFYRYVFLALFFRKNTMAHHILAVLTGGFLFGLAYVTTVFGLKFLLYSFSGMIFVAIYRWTRDIRLSFGVHFINNFVASL